jgi:multiple sugar transport system permease protein
MAGDLSPDIFYVNFRQYYTFLEQGFCRPLDDLIADDATVLDRVNPTILEVIKSYDGNVYAVPFFQVAMALYYRRDYFLEVGLDPNRPPRTWDEFYEYARKLTKPGRAGFTFPGLPAWHWSNFVFQAGGEIVRPAAGTDRWQSVIATEAGAKAIEFYRRLVLPQNGEPPVANVVPNLFDDVNQGKTAMWFSYTNDVVLQQSDLSPSLIGVAALPSGPVKASNEINAGMWAISSRVTDPKKVEAAWRFIKFFSGDDAARINTEKLVEFGIGNLVNPVYLERFGYKDLLAQVDPSYVEANRKQFQTGHPEPYGKNCQQVYEVLNQALDRARLEPETPAMDLLKTAQQEMDQMLLGYTPPEVMQVRRGWATGIGFSLLAALTGLAVWAVRRARQVGVPAGNWNDHLPAGVSKRRVYTFVMLCLVPAALSLLVWAYYPLARGLLIAFQDYRLLGGSRWVGMDNFIGVFTQPVFYKSLLNSFIYVGLSLLIGFFLPILLALALNEIPRLGTFFRVVFYLPAMTSPLVVALVWRQFYDKTEQGTLNAVLKPLIDMVNPLWTALGNGPIATANDWLGSPNLAMFAVVLPGIWAGAGAGSILYLAALKNISTERYEAADLDGATWIHKIVHITLPGIKPLILINLLGVFIAGFKAMENVFVLTQGGPLNATRTIGLEVWQNAFMFLRFGYATAAAWVMGAILIGFTVIQIRSLLKMRFTTARI